IDPLDLIWGSEEEIGGRWQLWGFGDPNVRCAWRRAQLLGARGEVLVPAQAVHCPGAGWALGPTAVQWTSNGMGAHPRRELALRHALLEAIERDQLARALPNFWTEEAISSRMID